MIRALVVQRNIHGSLRDVFYELAENPAFFPKYFKGFPPLIPGIRKITPAWNGSPVVGGLRRVDLGDGTSVQERVTTHEPPKLHRYEMAEMNFMQKLVCQKMHAEFVLKDAGETVDVTWTYWIESGNPLQYPLVAFLSWAFKKAMERFMDSVVKARG